MKKITVILLAAALLFTSIAMASCAENDPGATTTKADETTAEPETEPASTERLPDPVPELDLGNMTVTFIVRGSSYAEWESQDIFEEEDSDDPIKSAVFRRNMTLQDKYHCTIEQYGSSSPGADAKKAINANTDEYQVLMCDTQETLGLAQSNLLADLNALDGIDTKNPWWDQNLVKNCSIGGRLYFATGDISIMDNDATWVLMFNKKMISDLDLESPYDLVKNNEWTYDKMFEMMQVAKSDENGNGKVDINEDRFGFATHNSSLGAFYYAAGLKVIEKDADDIPYFPEQNAEYVNLVLDKSIKIWSDKSLTASADRDGFDMPTLQGIFEEGRSLFLGEVMQLVFRLRAMEIDFGLIPFPKYDSAQQNYGHFVHSTSAMLSIPANCKNIEKIAAFVEAMSYESMYTLTPAYYETALTGKYFRDPESKEMLDIILQSRTFDLGSTHMFDWGGVASVFTSLLSKGSNAYASNYAKKIKSGKKTLEKTVSKLLK
ncbi:MAG: extracellular solute-binding protein [Clostridia bacterium]|nr:extracellular solute-binding protein [Clostridia bacterium]